MDGPRVGIDLCQRGSCLILLKRRPSVEQISAIGLPGGLILRGCTPQTKGERWWVGLPGRPYTAHDSQQSWSNVCDFRDRATCEKFQDLATDVALAAYRQGGS
jgi:hypothetical protein